MEHSRSTRHGVSPSKAAAIALLWVAGAQAEGLVLHAPESSITDHTPSEYALAHARATTGSVRVFGNYYFFDPAQADNGPALGSLLGGFRASTGVAGLAQPMSLFDAQPESTQNLPYLGLGYSRLWFNSQLSLNADFGLASQSGANRLRGLLSGQPALDDAAGNLRWAPLMAVNVSYSF